MADLDPKGEGDKSMPGNPVVGPSGRGRRIGEDPRDRAKAGLPEAQSPVDASSHPPEGPLKPVPCSVSGSMVTDTTSGARSDAQRGC